MPPEAVFVTVVAEAYAHLYDLVFLRKSPLVDYVAPDSPWERNDRAWQLHHLLVDLIRELEPEPEVPAFSRPWRRHQLMVLRYVKALEPQAVMEQLNISRRHYYREHGIAIDALATLLWQRYGASQPSAPEPAAPAVAEQASLSQLELLRLETARMARASRFARLGEVLDGVLPLLGKMLEGHGLRVQVDIPPSMPTIAADPSLLRQLLLAILGHLAETATQGVIHVMGQSEEAVFGLALRIEPPGVVRTVAQDETEERLSAFAELAALAGGQVLPEYTDQSLTGFSVQLPIARRTVLIVDDNEDVLELMRRYLAPHPYDVVTAHTAQEGLTLARRLQPYAISLDLMMPEQDGWDLLQVLLNQPDTRHIPVIVCTVLKQKQMALLLGATAFLQKPVSEPALLAVLESLERE
jgi:CheY-like chemotaxis protein